MPEDFLVRINSAVRWGKSNLRGGGLRSQFILSQALHSVGLIKVFLRFRSEKILLLNRMGRLCDAEFKPCNEGSRKRTHPRQTNDQILTKTVSITNNGKIHFM